MNKCGENDFLDVVTDDCMSCDQVCYIRSKDWSHCLAYCAVYLSKHPELQRYMHNHKETDTQVHQTTATFSLTSYEDNILLYSSLGAALCMLVALCLLGLVLYYFGYKCTGPPRDELSEKSKEKSCDSDEKDETNLLHNIISWTTKAFATKKHHHSGGSTDSEKRLLDEPSSKGQCTEKPQLTLVDECGPPGYAGPSALTKADTTKLGDILKTEGIEFEPNTKPSRKNSFKPNCSLRELGQEGRMCIRDEGERQNALQVDAVGWYYEETNRKLCESTISDRQTSRAIINNDSVEESEPRLSELLNWMLKVDWIEEYIPSTEQLKVGIDLLKINEEEARTAVEREMKRCAMKLNLIVFPSSGGHYVPSMFHPSQHHRTAFSADPFGHSSSDEEEKKEKKEKFSGACRYPVECTDGHSSVDEPLDLSQHSMSGRGIESLSAHSSMCLDSGLDLEKPRKGEIYLYPGSQLYCHEMEPNPDGKICPGTGMSGGCIEIAGREFGLTVGHLFKDKGAQCRLTNYKGDIVGICDEKIDTVIIDGIETLADLTLIKLEENVLAVNTIKINNCSYRLRLFTGKISSLLGENVIMVSQNGYVRYGKIVATAWNNKKAQIYNVISVIEDKPTNRKTRINEEGDSGSLLLSRPRNECHDGDELEVYGMVTGYYESDDRTESQTIACKLFDVLRVHLGEDKIQFVSPESALSESMQPGGASIPPNLCSLDSAYFSYESSTA